MNQSSILSSGQESSFLNQSLFIYNPGLRVQSEQQKEGNQTYEIVFNKELISKHQLLFAQTIKLLQRSPSPNLKRLASQYRQTYDSLHTQESHSNLLQKPFFKQPQNKEKLQILQQHQKHKEESEKIVKESQDLMIEILKNENEKRSNRQKIKRMVNIIKQAKQSSDRNPFQDKIDQQYQQEIQKILILNQQGEKKSNLGMRSQDPENVYQSEKQAEQARRKRMQAEIDKLQAQKSILEKMTEKEKLMYQKQIEKKSESEGEIQKIYEQFQMKHEPNMNANIIGLLVEKFIDQQTKDDDYSKGLDRPIDEMVENVNTLRKETSLLKNELKHHQLIHSQKLKQCQLLEKELTDLRKQKTRLQNNLDRQDETQEQISSQLMNNQEMILKTYHYEGNKIQSEVSQIEDHYKNQELNVVLEQKSKSYLECNQKVSVKKQDQGLVGQLKSLLAIKNSKQFLKIVVAVWTLILAYVSINKMLIYFEYLPKPSDIEPVQTVIHRYQGSDGYVKQKTMTLEEHEAQFKDRKNKQKQSREDEQVEQPQQEVIQIQSIPQRTKQSWQQIMMREYK